MSILMRNSWDSSFGIPILDKLDSLYVATDCAPVTQHDLRIWLATQLNVDLQDEIVEQKAIRRCSNQRLLETGYKFIYPGYKEGYQSLMA